MSKDVNFSNATTLGNTSNSKAGTPPSSTPKKRNANDSMMWLHDAYNSARGETALWVAVITQAMMDALSRCKKTESQYQKHEATVWLTNNSKDFIDVCLCAGMNPDYVRKKAKNILSSPRPWRAAAGEGKRYEERRRYREKRSLEAAIPQNIETKSAEIISLI